MAAVKYALKGRIATMDPARTVVANGVVWINGASIAAVTPSIAGRPADFAGVTVTDTGGTIYPGMIELHNHLAYNSLKLWRVPKLFGNRDQWPKHPQYSQLVTRPMRALGSEPEHVAAIARYTEAKCLLSGVTTSEGITLAKSPTIKRAYRGVVRNAEQPRDKLLKAAATKIGDPQDNEMLALSKRLKKLKCYLGHLSEGVDNHARARFLNLQFQPNSWALAPSYCGIHANGLQDEDLAVLAQHGAAIVWSPLSNLLLYGQTLRLRRAVDLGIRIALGSDWSPSGSRNLLGEMKIARAQANIAGVPLSGVDIVAMTTSAPAQMLGWDHLLGSISAGKYADLIVVNGKGGNAYDHLIDANEKSISAVVIGGRVRVAEPSLQLIAAADAETVMVDGAIKHIDIHDADSDPLVEGLSLAAAAARLRDGLARIPQLHADLLARAQLGLIAARTSRRRTWFLALEEDEEMTSPRAPNLAAAAGRDGLQPPILRDLDGTSAAAAELPLVPLELDPLTIAGDPDYVSELIAQGNLPQSLKDALS
jgi:5-methylthioadenosine/S-adenosylhomocysteine deaminase